MTPTAQESQRAYAEGQRAAEAEIARLREALERVQHGLEVGYTHRPHTIYSAECRCGATVEWQDTVSEHVCPRCGAVIVVEWPDRYLGEGEQVPRF